MVDASVHVVDRAVIAYILFALYGRCRNSDLQLIHSLHRDFDSEGGYVVMETCNHKSGRKAALKTKLMPIVVPVRGVDGSMWVEGALSAFGQAGVLLDNPIDGRLMHAPADGPGNFMRRGFRSAEASSMLRRFLELEEPVPGCASEIVSSHSLKATLLSWAARFGLSPATRSMLGRHTSCLNETYAIYSRDLVCAPVAELQAVIDAISSGDFMPDSQRSEFFRAKGGGVPATHDTASTGDPIGPGYTPVPSPSYEPSLVIAGCMLTMLNVRSQVIVRALSPAVQQFPMQAPSFQLERPENMTSCDEFISDAVTVGHPIGNEARLPTALADALEFVRSTPMHEVAKHRCSALSYWLERGTALQDSETALHETMPKDLKDILAPKRLLLWKEMLDHYGYPDTDVFNEVVSGIELAGTAPFVPSFDPCFKPAKVTTNELAKNARAARIALFSSVRSSGNSTLGNEVFSKTMAELDCGWLEGPFEPHDLPDGAVVSRRFGIQQSSGESTKVRLTDDFTASGVNATVQVDSSSKLHTLDVVAAISMELLRSSPDKDWVGKTVDLSSAYRQLGVSPNSKWVSYIAVYDPSTRTPKVFSMKALPFGASRSVYGFLRVAHSLWWLGCVALKLLWSNFFDDFVTLCRSKEADTMSIVTSQFFKLLGWEISSGEKDLPFAASFKALGVEVNLSNWAEGSITFGNTQKRVAELIKTIDDVLNTKLLTMHAAQVLRGRMQFAKSQLWGRAAKLCLSAVTSHAFSDSVPVVQQRTFQALKCFRDSLLVSRPREITSSWDTPLYVFTDASFCPGDLDWPCGLGGVVDQFGNQISAMSYSLDFSELAILGHPPKSTVIFEAELLALVLCLVLWRKHLRNRPCVAYIDNNSTRDVAISGTARTDPGSQLVAKLLANEDSCGSFMWYARVPSTSNVADAPSRGSADGIRVRFLPKELVRIVVSRCLDSVRALQCHEGPSPK
eukprot:s403_g15.t1